MNAAHELRNSRSLLSAVLDGVGAVSDRTCGAGVSPALPFDFRAHPGIPHSALRTPHFIREGFSLAELMIAVVILGLGLLVAAAMFPIAWGKARDLTEHTTAESCTVAAELAVKLTCQVDSASECANYTSFAGDYIQETSPVYPSPATVYASDTLVHPLTLQNILAVPPPGGGTPIIAETAWLLSDAVGTLAGDDDLLLLKDDINLVQPPPTGCGPVAAVRWYDAPQLQFQERLFPPLTPWPDPSATTPPPPEEIDRWNALIEQRKYSWAVFHRLNQVFPPLPCSGQCLVAGTPEQKQFFADRKKAAAQARVFTMYYVTLRRGTGQRFAQQDETALPVNVKALSHTASSPTDVKFPSPWLVPLITPDPNASPRELNFRINPSSQVDVVPRGVPTEVTVELPTGVPSGGNATCEDFREFFPEGARFIDHESGELFTVAKRRYDDTGDPKKAILTLDREIFVEEISPPGGVTDPTQRRVWVFPPAIEPREGNAPLAILGASPVVDIAVRSMTIHPQ